jgi:hypothetical protein
MRTTGSINTQMFPPDLTPHFIARHFCAHRMQSTLGVLTLFFMNVTYTTDNMRTTRDGTHKVLCALCTQKGHTPKRGVRTGGNSCITLEILNAHDQNISNS